MIIMWRGVVGLGEDLANGDVEKVPSLHKLNHYVPLAMKTVGVDLHIRSKVPSCTNSTATRHIIMGTVNEMGRMDCLYRRNALGRIIENAN